MQIVVCIGGCSKNITDIVSTVPKTVTDNSSNTGKHICGDLDKLRQVVLRELNIKQPIYDAINEVSKKGKGNDGTQYSIETAESHHKTKYKNNGKVTIAWKQDNFLLYFLSEIKRKFLD